jgi:hypothetical protein
MLTELQALLLEVEVLEEKQQPLLIELEEMVRQGKLLLHTILQK